MKRGPGPQSITWFLDLERTGRLELDPPYQRKSVWTLKDRRYFLDTIFRGYPSPPIFIHQDTSDEGITTYYVVDGKQRLETILMFHNNKIRIGSDFGEKGINDKLFNELNPEQKRKFWDYVIIVDFVETTDSLSINEIFDRLNRNSKNLNDQELRHARYSGWFIDEVERETQNPLWGDVGISTKTKSKRMGDIQFVSQLLMVVLEKKIVGFEQNHITEIYAAYEDPSDNQEFDEDLYLQEKEKTKKYIEQMENTDQHVITKWAKTANNFYTLWSLIVLHSDNLPLPEKLAIKYDSFMSKVHSVNAEADPNVLSKQENLAYNYYSNSRGASTDLKQRKIRFESLDEALLKMKVVNSIRQCYDEQFYLNKKLRERVDTIVKTHKEDEWHYFSRIKKPVSYALKVETGRIDDPTKLDDFFGCTIIVRNNFEINIAKEKIINPFFNVEYFKPPSEDSTHKSPESFPYDNLRFYVKLKPSEGLRAASQHYELSDIMFEIQIKVTDRAHEVK